MSTTRFSSHVQVFLYSAAMGETFDGETFSSKARMLSITLYFRKLPGMMAAPPAAVKAIIAVNAKQCLSRMSQGPTW